MRDTSYSALELSQLVRSLVGSASEALSDVLGEVAALLGDLSSAALLGDVFVATEEKERNVKLKRKGIDASLRRLFNKCRRYCMTR